jgi:hypothetical protein
MLSVAAACATVLPATVVGATRGPANNQRMPALTFEPKAFQQSGYTEDGQAWQVECNPRRPPEDCARVVHAPVRSGANAIRITVRQGDSAFGWNESAELARPIPADGQSDAYHQYHAVAPDEGQGDEYWYRLSVKFDIRSRAVGWHAFWQWHGWDGYSAPISFSYNFSDLQLSLFAGLLSGDSGLPATSRTTNGLVPGRSLALNVPFGLGWDGRPLPDRWHDILVHIKWTALPNTGGFVEVFHKYADQPTYRRVIDLRSTPQFPRGIPTLHMTSFDRNGNASQQVLTNYMKFGYYRKSYCRQPTAPDAWKSAAACGSTTGVQPTDTLYFDDFAQSRNRDEIDSTTAHRPTSTTPAPARRQ